MFILCKILISLMIIFSMCFFLLIVGYPISLFIRNLYFGLYFFKKKFIHFLFLDKEDIIFEIIEEYGDRNEIFNKYYQYYNIHDERISGMNVKYFCKYILRYSLNSFNWSLENKKILISAIISKGMPVDFFYFILKKDNFYKILKTVNFKFMILIEFNQFLRKFSYKKRVKIINLLNNQQDFLRILILLNNGNWSRKKKNIKFKSIDELLRKVKINKDTNIIQKVELNYSKKIHEIVNRRAFGYDFFLPRNQEEVQLWGFMLNNCLRAGYYQNGILIGCFIKQRIEVVVEVCYFEDQYFIAQIKGMNNIEVSSINIDSYLKEILYELNKK